MFRRADKGGEAGWRIEARKTQPVNGTVAPHERGSLAVTDEGVIFNQSWHGILLMFDAV